MGSDGVMAKPTRPKAKCPHGHLVKVITLPDSTGPWVYEQRPVDVCAPCREQDDGRALDHYIQHPYPHEDQEARPSPVYSEVAK